jgi:hypothetical protein
MPNDIIEEDDFTSAFGDDFWDRPHEERFELVLKACCGVFEQSSEGSSDDNESD